MKKKNDFIMVGGAILWVVLVSAVFFVFSLVFGTPWERIAVKEKMEDYLENKYELTFKINDISYNYLSETYQAYAAPENEPQLEFFVQEASDAKSGYADSYPLVFWGSGSAKQFKEKIENLFPKLEPYSLDAKTIVERGEVYGPNIPTYKESGSSHLAASIRINVIEDWTKLDQQKEYAKIKDLSEFFQNKAFPVLIEIRYFENEFDESKVIYIAEDGSLIEK